MPITEKSKEQEVLTALGQPVYWYYFDWKAWHELFRLDSSTGNSWRFDKHEHAWLEYRTENMGRKWNLEFFADLYGND